MSICQEEIASEREVCEVLDLNRSSFQTWQRFQESERDRNDADLQSKIVPIFHRHRGRYGSRRILAELKDMDTITSRRRITKLLKNAGLRPIQAKSFKPRTTESRHALGYNENLLLDMPEPAAINQLWVADITYIPVSETGFGYLAMIMDRYSRRIIGWDFRNDMTEQLTINALRQAIKTTQPVETLIHHSDRGGQYAGKRYRAILKRSSMRQSMSRAGDCYDNAFMESCFGTLKTDLEMTEYKSMVEARSALFEYITYYNELRRHSSLGYLTPIQFEALM